MRYIPELYKTYFNKTSKFLYQHLGISETAPDPIAQVNMQSVNVRWSIPVVHFKLAVNRSATLSRKQNLILKELLSDYCRKYAGKDDLAYGLLSPELKAEIINYNSAHVERFDQQYLPGFRQVCLDDYKRHSTKKLFTGARGSAEFQHILNYIETENKEIFELIYNHLT